MEMVDFKCSEVHVQFIGSRTNNADEEAVVHMYYFVAGELCVMNRKMNDPMEKSLWRLSKSYMEKRKKSLKKKKCKQKVAETSETGLHVTVTMKDEYVDIRGLTNADFQSHMIISFSDVNLQLLCDAPLMTNISVFPRRRARVNMPLVPCLSTDHSDGVDCLWCVEELSSSNNYFPLSENRILLPPIDCLGRHVKLYCTPWRKDGLSGIIKGRTCVHYVYGPIVEELHHTRLLGIRGHFMRKKLLTDQHLTIQECDPNSDGRDNSIHDIHNRIVQIVSSFEEASSSRTDEKQPELLLSMNLRVVSWNVLAEVYAIQEEVANEIYSHIHLDHLVTEYRSPLILQELLFYSADVICLQECDGKTYDHFYQPFFSQIGYSCCYSNKCSGVREGCATFTRSATLRVLRRITIPFKSVLRDAIHLQPLYEARPDLRDIIGGKIGAIAQITVCQSTLCPRNVLIIVNTHLFYHPNAPFIRLLQMDVICRVVQKLRSEILRQGVPFAATVEGEDLFEQEAVASRETFREVCCIANDQIQCGVVILGDLNSVPGTATLEYLESGYISETHAVWKSVNDFSWESDSVFDLVSVVRKLSVGSETLSPRTSTNPSVASSRTTRAVAMPECRHGLNLLNTAGHALYSNYTIDFKALLDYIFIDRDCLQLLEVSPFPTEADWREIGTIPSQIYPSDHIPIAVDVSFVK